ncbi:MAG: M3 family oligoendopeptidase [Bdellovibrio sp.]|nr:M3 family oligoendopeptidase [Bdellovibrio sp.]
MKNMTWNLDSAYTSFTSAEFVADTALVQQKLEQLSAGVKALREPFDSQIPEVQKYLLLRDKIITILATQSTYLSCLLSVDGTLEEARAKKSEVSNISSQLEQTTVPLFSFIKSCSNETLQKLLNHPELSSHAFSWHEKRKVQAYQLSNPEEVLLQSVENPGFHAWSELYNKISGSMKCELQYPDRKEVVGLAQASAMIRNKDETTRKVAWTAIQNAWEQQKDTAAAILNSLVGWRHEVYKKRSNKEPLHFLDPSLTQSRITRKTLDALMTACYENIETSRKANSLLAKVLGKSTLAPWDLLAPSPISTQSKDHTYAEALEMITGAVGKINPEMSKFVTMMAEKNWIEGRVLPNKRNGAFCTGFLKAREPRVFMTYLGSNSDVSTLAHELGHAYHSWVMRDLPLAQSGYPMTLAETASIFFETVLHDSLSEKADSQEAKVESSWGEVSEAVSLLLNIPARFEFEKNFYEQRQKRSLSADELSQLTDEAWTKWYGPTLSANDKMFWASKLHFSISGVSFYNYPYTFGYLFSLSIYAHRESLGKDFAQTYVNILRDTGRMTAEDLIKKHLGEDIKDPAFWRKAIAVVNQKIEKFEKLVQL